MANGAIVFPLLLLAGWLAGCGPTGGAVDVQGAGADAQLVMTARSGKANVVTVTSSGPDLLVSDSGDVLVPGNGCAAVNTSTVRCAGARSIRLDLGDLGDRATNATALPSAPGGILGGPGDDILNGGRFHDLLVGGAGNDTLVGEEGDDVMEGGGDNDSLSEGSSEASTDVTDDDVFSGGPGADLASYALGAQRVVVSLDDFRNDGQIANETDYVMSDVESVTGGAGPDLVRGNSNRNVFRGGGGNDVFFGEGGVDLFFGDGGDDAFEEGNTRAAVDELDADTFDGGDGVDRVVYGVLTAQDLRVDLDDVGDDGLPGEGDNVRTSVEQVTGGDGDDVLVGDGSADRLSGLGGDDILLGNAGADSLLGGSGFDTLNGGTGIGVDTCNVGLDGGSTANCEVIVPQ